MTRKNPYAVPKAYFESLQARLSSIPEECPRRQEIHLSPYITLVAVFAVALILGNVFVRQNEPALNSLSEDEITEYLIESGVTLAQFEDTVEI